MEEWEILYTVIKEHGKFGTRILPTISEIYGDGFAIPYVVDPLVNCAKQYDAGVILIHTNWLVREHKCTPGFKLLNWHSYIDTMHDLGQLLDILETDIHKLATVNFDTMINSIENNEIVAMLFIYLSRLPRLPLR